MLSMVTWIPSIYPLYVSIYTSTMDPSWVMDGHIPILNPIVEPAILNRSPKERHSTFGSIPEPSLAVPAK